MCSSDLAGKHLERHQHANRKTFVLHHDQGAHTQDRQGLSLLYGVGDRVGGVGELSGLKPCGQVSRQQVVVALFEIRGSICSDFTVSMPPTYSVRNAWLRAPSRNCSLTRWRSSGVMKKLSTASKTTVPTDISESCQLYQNITARNTNKNGKSRHKVTAAPLMN